MTGIQLVMGILIPIDGGDEHVVPQHGCIYVYIHNAHMCIYIHVCMCIHIYTYIYMCVFIYIYMYLYIYIIKFHPPILNTPPEPRVQYCTSDMVL